MKMKKFFKNFSLMGVIMLVMTAVLGIVDSSSVLAMPFNGKYQPNSNGMKPAETNTGAGAVATGAGEQVGQTYQQGLDMETTKEMSPDLLMETISDEIVKIRPTYTPFDTIMRHSKARKAESEEYAWYSVDIRPVSTEGSGTIVQDGGANKVGVKDGTITVADAGLFNASDTIYLETGGEEYMFYVISADTEKNTLKVAAVDDVTGTPIDVPAVSVEGIKIYRLGRAAVDGEIQTDAYAAVPTKETNYCQIFKWQVSQTTLQKLSKKEVNWDMSDIEEQAASEFRIQQEASFLFGRKGKFYDPIKKKPVYTTGGLVNYITKTKQLDSAKIDDELIDLAKFVFQGNIGNRKRIMFMGSEFNAMLSKAHTVQKQLEAGNVKIVWGLEFNEIRTNFGSLMCMQHDLFDQYGWSKKALILDVDNVDKWKWTEESKSLDTKTSGTFDGDVKVYTEVCGTALRYPDTHCIVTYK